MPEDTFGDALLVKSRAKRGGTLTLAGRQIQGNASSPVGRDSQWYKAAGSHTKLRNDLH